MNEKDHEIFIFIDSFFLTTSSAIDCLKPLKFNVFTGVFIQELKLKEICLIFKDNLFILVAIIKIKNKQIVFNRVLLWYWEILLSNNEQIIGVCDENSYNLTSFVISRDLDSVQLIFIIAVNNHHVSILYSRKGKIWPIKTKRLYRVAHISTYVKFWLRKLISYFLFFYICVFVDLLVF